MKKYKLFSAVKRCSPCRALVSNLDHILPDWKSYTEYIDVDDMTPEQAELAAKLEVRLLPSFTDEETILITGFSPIVLKRIIEYAEKRDPEQSGDI